MPKIRPQTLAQVADRSNNGKTFGLCFTNWLHEVREWENKEQAINAIREEPRLLAPVFMGGKIADAWLAAYAEYIESVPRK